MQSARRRVFQSLVSLSSPSSSSSSHIARGSLETLTKLSSNGALAAPWAANQTRSFKVHGSDVRPGNVIERNGRFYEVLKAQHTQQGRGGATIQAELRDVDSGNKMSQRFRTDESIEKVFVEQKAVTYLYQDGDAIVLMDSKTFEQVEVSSKLLGKAAVYLKDIVNPLKALGKAFPIEEVVQRVLSSLPPQWNDAKTTTIEEAHDLSTISFEELMGKLMAHEVQMNVQSGEPSKMKDIAFEAKSDSESNDIDQVKNMFKKFNNILKRNLSGRRLPQKRKTNPVVVLKMNLKKFVTMNVERKDTSSQIVQNSKFSTSNSKAKDKKHQKKKKAFKDTWGDLDILDSSSSESEQKEAMTTVCFMAHEDQDERMFR